MTDEQFLNSDLLKTPIIRTEDDFSNFATKYLQTYLGMLNSMDCELKTRMNERIPIIRDLIYNLISSVEFYYLGNVSQAYQFFHNGVSAVTQYLWMDNIGVSVYYDEKTENSSQEDFFKARVSEGKPYSKNEMFIRPFEQREHINTYRYSIPGLPCLYLSSNIFTAWKELNCPDINTMQVSRFILDKSLKRLRFAFDINFWKGAAQSVDGSYSDKLYNFLTYFPLHAMCNVKVKNHLAVFKPEYIFPQFLMQWVKEDHHIDMVEYGSTRINFMTPDLSAYSYLFKNIAIPAQSSYEKGVCTQLQSKVKLTDPISWQQLLTTYPSGDMPIKETEENINVFRFFNNSLRVELINGKPVWYKNTMLGKMEKFILDEMAPSYLKI